MQSSKPNSRRPRQPPGTPHPRSSRCTNIPNENVAALSCSFPASASLQRTPACEVGSLCLAPGARPLGLKGSCPNAPARERNGEGLVRRELRAGSGSKCPQAGLRLSDMREIPHQSHSSCPLAMHGSLSGLCIFAYPELGASPGPSKGNVREAERRRARACSHSCSSPAKKKSFRDAQDQLAFSLVSLIWSYWAESPQNGKNLHRNGTTMQDRLRRPDTEELRACLASSSTSASVSSDWPTERHLDLTCFSGLPMLTSTLSPSCP